MSTTAKSVQMIGVDEALDYILRHIRPLDSRMIPLVDALDRVLAGDIVSDIDIPPFVNSAMDGYAVRSEDVAVATDASPVTLRVVGEEPAGSVPDCSVVPGSGVRSMTGAPMPPGSDAVVPIELTSEGQAQAGQTGGQVRHSFVTDSGW